MKADRELHNMLQKAIDKQNEKLDKQDVKLDKFLSMLQTVQITQAVSNTERENIDKRLIALEAEADIMDKRLKITNVLEAIVAIMLGIFGINR